MFMGLTALKHIVFYKNLLLARKMFSEIICFDDGLEIKNFERPMGEVLRRKIKFGKHKVKC
mgnify:CR=1 FL=1